MPAWRACAELVDAGAAWIDVGGETAAGGRPAVDAAEEAERVVPVIAAAVAAGAVVSVDTYKPAVAEAALAAGAAVVNDVSGLADPELAAVCAAGGAALVVMHTRAAPKATLLDPGFYDDVVADVRAFLEERMAVATGQGLAAEQLLVDPGPDFTKTPAQTVAVLRRLEDLHALGRPVLLAVSRKDFVGAITGARRASEAPAHSRRSRRASTPARTCCACTTSPRRRTTSRCARCSARRTGSWETARACLPSATRRARSCRAPGSRAKGTVHRPARRAGARCCAKGTVHRPALRASAPVPR